EHVQMPHQRHPAQQQRVGNRRPDQHRRQQRTQKDRNGHGCTPFLSCTCGSCSSPWCSCSTIDRSSDSEIWIRSLSATLPLTSSHSRTTKTPAEATANTTPAP